MSAGHRTFTFHFFLCLAVLVLFAGVDVMMARHQYTTRYSEGVDVGFVEIEPYHFYVMGVLYYGMVGLVGVTYYYSRRDVLGTVILFAVGSILSLCLVEDVVYFALKREPIPETWNWIYYWHGQNVSGTTVMMLAFFGMGLVVFLYLYQVSRRRMRQ